LHDHARHLGPGEVVDLLLLLLLLLLLVDGVGLLAQQILQGWVVRLTHRNRFPSKQSVMVDPELFGLVECLFHTKTNHFWQFYKRK
jgi:hypothetical protein